MVTIIAYCMNEKWALCNAIIILAACEAWAATLWGLQDYHPSLVLFLDRTTHNQLIHNGAEE